MPQTSANPKPLKAVLCFSDGNVYNHAARSIRQVQFDLFDIQRLSSQPDEAIHTKQLLSATARFRKGDPAFTQDLLTKEGDGEDSLKVVSISQEELVIEPKSSGFFNKRTVISTVGIPISFISPIAISVPARVANVTFTFSNSRDRDIFACKLFLHSKGDPQAAMTFSGPGTLFSSEPREDQTLSSENVEDEDEDAGADPLRPFVAVVEKQRPCEFRIRTAADGAPHLYASPTAESRALVCKLVLKLCCFSRLIRICRVFLTD